MTNTFWEEIGGTLFEEAGDALFLFDPETEQVVDVNPMAQRLTSHSRQELLGFLMTQLVRSEAEGGTQRMRLAFRRTGVFHSQEGFWLRHKGAVPWVPVNLTITRLHTAPRVLGLLTARDISERRAAQQQLEESELRYRTLFETSIQGIVIHQDGFIRFGNPALARMFGYDSPAELVGKNLWQTLVHPSEWPILQQRTEAFLRGEVLPIHPGWQGIRRDGSAIWVQATASRIAWQGRPALCGFFLDITARRRAELALRDSLSKQRLLLEQVPAIIWTTDAELRITSNQGAALAALGRRADGDIGLTLYDIVQSTDPDYLPIQAHRQALLGESVNYHMEFQGRSWQTHIEPLRQADGQIVGTVGITLDITEQRLAEGANRESQRALATLMSNLPGMAYRCLNEPNWTMEFASEGAWELTCYHPEDLVSDRAVAFSSLIQAEDRERVWRDVQAAVAHKQPYRLTYRLVTALGETKWVWEQGSGVFSATGQLVALEGFITDITESKQAEEALRASESKYRALIDNLTQCVFLKDRQLRFVAVNPPFCRTFGRSPAELLGLDDYAISPPHLADKYRADDLRVLRDRCRVDLEEQTMIGGKLRTVQTVKTPVLDAQGQAIGVLGIFWDVTDQRELEAQLRQAHKMEAVGQLAGGIAHDFNNLLTGILGNLSLALADLPDNHAVRDLLGSAEQAGLRAAELTRQLLSFSRRTPFLPRPVALAACLDETVRLLRRTFDQRIRLEISCAADLLPIQADAGQINQVLMNLCLNARDAMPEGGQLFLEASNVLLDADAAARLQGARPGTFVRLRITDSGTGMTPEIRERIFEPFFTTKEQGKGTGLGLAMVFGIVQQHQGWIECRSELGRGTTFDLYLPALPASKMPQTAAPAPAGAQGGHETILLADDEEVVGRLAETILRRQGYRVLQASDGVEAVELYRQYQKDIQLVILDLSMPRLSGPEALRELRKLNPAVTVLISSGYSSEDNFQEVDRAGVAGFVAKPYRPADLIRQVRAALDGARGK